MDLTSATIEQTAIEREEGAQVAVFLPTDQITDTLTGDETDFELLKNPHREALPRLKFSIRAITAEHTVFVCE